jgi:hypothetical protein
MNENMFISHRLEISIRVLLVCEEDFQKFGQWSCDSVLTLRFRGTSLKESQFIFGFVQFFVEANWCWPSLNDDAGCFLPCPGDSLDHASPLVLHCLSARRVARHELA